MVVVRLPQGSQDAGCVVPKPSHALLTMLHSLAWSFIHAQEEYFSPKSHIGSIWASGSSVSFVFSWEKCLAALEEGHHELQNMAALPLNCKPGNASSFPGLQMRDL